MPFFCSREAPSRLSLSSCQTTARIQLPEPIANRTSAWEVLLSPPTKSNLNKRRDQDPLVLLDGYLSNRASLFSRLGTPPSEAVHDAQLIGAYLARHPDATAADLKGCLFVCILSPRTGEITLFRDRLGGRTGYWHQGKLGLAAASHASDIARFGNIGFQPDPAFLASCFSLSSRPPVGHSAFDGIKELEPGETVKFRNGEYARWRAPTRQAKESVPESINEQAEQFRHLLTSSIDNTIRHRAQPTAMVSGGLDSGPMALIADQLLSRAGGSLQAISWHLPAHPTSDERRWVDMLAPALKNPIQFFDGDPLGPFNEITNAQVSLDAPLWNPCRSLVERCYQLASEQGSEVILNGNAGDLLYPERTWLFMETLQQAGWSGVFHDIGWIVSHYGWRTALRDPAIRRLAAKKLGVDIFRRLKPNRRTRSTYAWLTEKAKNYLILEDWPPANEGFGYPDHYRKVFGQTMAFGRAHEQPYALKYGLERNDPYQDEDLARFMLSLPFKSSFYKDKSKFIARIAARRLLPDPLWKKRRTGDLTPLISAGMVSNRRKIRSALENNQSWREWVRTEAVWNALNATNPNGHQQLLLSQCLAYVLWLEKHEA